MGAYNFCFVSKIFYIWAIFSFQLLYFHFKNFRTKRKFSGRPIFIPLLPWFSELIFLLFLPFGL